MRSRIALVATFAGACAAVASLVATSAHANGRFPAAQYFLAGKGSASGTLVLKTTFGLAVSDDRGASFRYLCEDALGYGKAVFDPAVALLPDRSILIGLSNGATHVSADRCTFDPIPSLSGQYLDDFDVDPSGKVVVAATSTGFTDDFNHIWRSEDGGATFTALGPGVKGTFIVSVEIARTDVTRVWASALQLSPRRVIVFRSDDGGATLVESSAFPYPDSDFTVVSGVDPSNRDVVYVRTEVTESTGRRTVLLRTRDGGASWHELVESEGEMLGFAIGDVPLRSRDPFLTRALFMGGPKDGLQRSDDDGATWTKLSGTQVQCLRWSDGVLYLCGSERNDPDAGIVGDHFAVADSCDRGATLHPLLGFLEIAGVESCDPSSPESTSCPDRWEGEVGVKWTFPTDDLPLQPLCSIHLDAGTDADADAATDDADTESLPDASDDVSDAGVGTEIADANDATGANEEPAIADGDSSNGCGCGVVGAASHATWIALALASALAALRARRA